MVPVVAPGVNTAQCLDAHSPLACFCLLLIGQPIYRLSINVTVFFRKMKITLWINGCFKSGGLHNVECAHVGRA